MKYKTTILLIIIIAFFLTLPVYVPASEKGSQSYVQQPKPDKEGDFIWWDGVYNMLVRPVGKLFDLGRYIKGIARALHLRGHDEAENVNALDEIPDTSWFANRHGKTRMSSEKLARGANSGPGIDTNNDLIIVAGKSIGISPGLIVKDSRGDIYILKFDPPNFPELATSAEIISSKFMYAAGYNVPEYTIAYIDPKKIKLGENVKTKGKYKISRPMTQADVDIILKKVHIRGDGMIRVSSTKLLEGKPLGPPTLVGTRKDDPNDLIPHQHLRELRGLRIVSSLINNSDCRRGNFLDMYVNEGDNHYVKHYILDFSSTIGSSNIEPKSIKYGNEYVVDPPKIFFSYLSLGFWIKPWEEEPEIVYPSVGSFESKIFHPKRWVTSYPNPAFVEMTPRDAFWGAKIVTAFSNDDIKTIVKTGEFSDSRAEEYVIRTFIERRNKIGRFWFDVKRINPLDDFRVTREKDGSWFLEFTDIAIDRQLAGSENTVYLIERQNKRQEKTSGQKIPIGPHNQTIKIRTSRDSGKHWGKQLQLTIQKQTSYLEVSSIKR